MLGLNVLFFLCVFADLGGCGKVREAEKKNFFHFSSKALQRVPSYDPKTKKVNDN